MPCRPFRAFVHAIPYFRKYNIYFVTFTPVKNWPPPAGSPPTLGSLAMKRLMFRPKGPSSFPCPIIILHSFRTTFSLHCSIRGSWHSCWDQCAADGNKKLAQLKPSLGPWSSCSQWCWHLEVSLSHLCIGHTHLTHGHLMAHEAPPICNCC